MKKLLSVWLCLMLVLGALPLALPTAAAPAFSVTGQWKNGLLTFAWDDQAAQGYLVADAKIGEETFSVSACSVIVAKPDTTKAVQLGFRTASSEEIEWVSVNVQYIFAMMIDAYKTNNKVIVTVTDEFDRSVPGGAKVHLTIGDSTISSTLSDAGTASIPVAGFENVTYGTVVVDDFSVGNVTYAMYDAASVNLALEDMTIPLTMTLFEHNGKIAAQVHASNGEAVEDVEVSLTFGSNKRYEVARTDSEGIAYFNVDASTKTKVTCVINDFDVRNLHYIGCSKVYQSDSGPTTRATVPTTTASRKDDRPTSTTYATFMGKGTTATDPAYPDYVVLDAIFDQGVLNAFGRREEDFRNNAKLLMKKSVYDSWIGADAVAILMTVSFSDTPVTDEEVQQVIDSTYELMSYQPSAVSRNVVVLGAKMRTAYGELVDLALDNAEYIIRLPIPKNMAANNLIAVSQRLNGTLSESVFASLRDDYLEISADNLAELVLMGVVGVAETKNNYFVFTLILVIVGVLLLIGAGLLLYFFVIRPAHDPDDEDDPDPVTSLTVTTARIPADDGVEDLYSDDPFVVIEDKDVVVPPIDDSDSIELFGDSVIIKNSKNKEEGDRGGR